MTKRELQKLIYHSKNNRKELTAREAAQALGLSERQIFRLKKGVSEQGEFFVIHKNKGHKPANATPPEVVNKVIYLKQNVYFDANFSHFRDLLEEREGIMLSQPTVYRILPLAGIESHRKHRKTHKTQRRRKRKPQAGMLVQIDCSPFKWLLNMGKLALYGAIDDATGGIQQRTYKVSVCSTPTF
jgi:transposase